MSQTSIDDVMRSRIDISTPSWCDIWKLNYYYEHQDEISAKSIKDMYGMIRFCEKYNFSNTSGSILKMCYDMVYNYERRLLAWTIKENDG